VWAVTTACPTRTAVKLAVAGPDPGNPTAVSVRNGCSVAPRSLAGVCARGAVQLAPNVTSSCWPTRNVVAPPFASGPNRTTLAPGGDAAGVGPGIAPTDRPDGSRIGCKDT